MPLVCVLYKGSDLNVLKFFLCVFFVTQFCGTELILRQTILVPTEARNLKSVPYVVLAQ